MIALLSSILFLFLATPQPLTSQRLLQRGKENYRAGKYDQAIDDLRNASAQFLGTTEKQNYIETGRLETLPQLEESLIYLALAYDKVGRAADARDAVMRLLNAEQIDAVYATLPLDPEASDFEPLAATVIPTIQLPPNPRFGRPAQAPPATGMTTEERIAELRLKIDREAAAKLAEIARDADARIAAAQRAADARVSAASNDTDTEKAGEEQKPSRRLGQPTQPAVPATRPAVPATQPAVPAATLADAAMLISTDDVEGATRIYRRIATAPNSSREMIAAAATGLYRTGAYADAAAAFKRLGTLGRGEEDLRFYKAVVLYESGDFGGAKRELACALPYIEVSDAVSRYRNMIERMPAR